ncbi:uncharacterized protein LOC133832201 [Humulus lupulus]|uniref:uncharacterized protein LOC133832201 n=1 Tax=Humulus lupulus TaxID=3486 RepID=UPI002B401FD2|nr:uncharacterized protein LOC133832201 [Humulus lupulus]
MSWNVRGLNKRNKQIAVGDICKINKIGIGALLETKIKGDRVKEVMNSRFMSWDYYSSKALEGRILLIWKGSWVRVDVLVDHAQFIHCKVLIWATGQSFCFTVVYGLNQIELRKSLWSELAIISLPVKPWLVIGDFNSVFDVEDRIGDGNNRIFSKLDRVFINEDWIDTFPNVNAIASWEVVSDHCAIILKHISVLKNGLRPFRFFNMWTSHPLFKPTVLASWNKSLSSEGCGLQQVLRKLHHLQFVLKRFNWRVVGDIVKEYEESKSKVDWLRLGDENSSLFYASMKKRKALNRIVSFVDENGSVEGLSKGYKSFYSAFSIFFRRSKCSNWGKKWLQQLIPILPKLINQNQGAFVKNRSIAHNILIIQDLLKGYNRKRVSPRCLMKIDLSKAYDSIDWDFLENLLNTYKFPGKFIKWIMVCLRGSSYSILMNGQLYGDFKGGKGLRQGDPISPLLFVLVMGYLTRALHGDAKDKHFRFHPLCKSLNITNLCFADDLLLVCKAHINSIQIMQQVFKSFSSASGLSINQAKSCIYFGGISSVEKEKILCISNMREGQFPLMYLGVPLRPTKWKAMDCDLIISKIRQRLHGWASRNLSYAGHVQLIQSVLLGIRNFWMSIFLLPQKVIKEIDCLCRIFLWGGNGFRSKFHLASWDHVCRPKSYGGLGFKEGVLWNKINLARYVWAISSKQDSLWVKWVNCI